MTTKPSAAPWADEPYKLLPTPQISKDIVLPTYPFPTPKLIWPQKNHHAVYGASEMAHSHNCLLRGLNAILQQGPHIPSSSQPGYNTQDQRPVVLRRSLDQSRRAPPPHRRIEHVPRHRETSWHSWAHVWPYPSA